MAQPNTKAHLILIGLIVAVFGAVVPGPNTAHASHTRTQSSITQKAAGEILSPTSSLLLRRGVLPDPRLTPGDIFPSATAGVICVHGYTQTVRNVPVSLKRKIYRSYHIKFPQPRGSYELDHFVPLELGGSNSAKNLWPEPARP